MKPKKNIDDMNLEEITAYNKELLAELKRLLAERTEQQPATTSEQEPTVEESPQYDLPTKRMEQAVARFDDRSDDDQVDQLKSMWGEA